MSTSRALVLVSLTVLTMQPPGFGQNGSSGSGAAPVAAQPAAGPYRVLKTFQIGGEGGWDYLTVDPEPNRLYVPRSTRVVVLDAQTGASVGEIPGTDGVHGVALGLGKGFTSNGKSDSVTVFDLKTLAVSDTVKVGQRPDAILFEPTTKRIFTLNAQSQDATAINATDLTVAGTVALGGKPEFAVVDGRGNVFVNIEDTSEVVRFDAGSGLAVKARFPLAPGEEPTGLAIDAPHHRLFAVCGNKKMVILDSESGKVLATPDIGDRVDGAAFDAARGYAISSNGEGTLSVVSEAGDKPFAVVQTLQTAPARTNALNPKTGLIYLPTADFEPLTDQDKAAGKTRPAMKAGTFRIVVVGP